MLDQVNRRFGTSFRSYDPTPENEARIERALTEMREVVGARTAPEVGWMKVCRSCSYADLCWG